MIRIRHAARLVPACGLALALMLPAAGYGAPVLDSSFVEHDKGGGKGGGGKGHGKQKQGKGQKQEHKKQKADKQKKNKQEHRIRTDRQRGGARDRGQRVERQQRRERERERQVRAERQLQRELDRQRQVDQQRRFERQRLDRERFLRRQRAESLRRDRVRAQAWPRSGDIADRPGRGIVHVQGEVTAEGLRCTALRGDDGRLFTLVGGGAQGLRPGDDLWVKGRVVDGSGCRQGTTLQIHQVRDLADRDDRWPDDRWDDRDTRDRRTGVGRYLEVEGRLTDESSRCHTMRGTDGRLYSLIGDLERFDEGDRVEVAGRVVNGSGCPGTVLQVEDIRGDGGGILERIFGRDRDDDRDDRWEPDRGELVNLRGRVASGGGCTLLRGDDGRTYELSGDLRGFGRGDTVRVVGVMEGGSRCGLGPSVRVAEIDGR